MTSDVEARFERIEKVSDLADSQKHTDQRLSALIDIVMRQQPGRVE